MSELALLTKKWWMNFESLDSDLQSTILSFGTEADLWCLSPNFPEAVTKALSSKTVINLSFLQTLFLNDIQQRSENNSQHDAVKQLMLLLLDSKEESYNLKYLECAGLRNVSGTGWLSKLPSSLQTLDLSGCAALDPDALVAFLKIPDPQLKHLNLTGCTGVSSQVVTVITEYHSQLESLWLGGCSQRVGGGLRIHRMLEKLQRLRHLDLQTLNHVTDASGLFMENLSTSIESLNLTACKQLRLAGLEALEAIQYQMNHLGRQGLDHWRNAPISRHDKMMHLVLDSLGTPRVGLCRGVLSYFAMGRHLREVHLSGCEQIQDWEVEALAVTCASTLTCLQMRACRITDVAIQALATHCEMLGEIDISACFRVGDAGILSLSETRRVVIGEAKRGKGTFRLRVLRLASLPGLTDRGITAIGNIDSLHVLDVEDCIEVRPTALVQTILRLPYLIDINAKGIADERNSFPALLRNAVRMSPQQKPQGLRMVNRRFHEWDNSDDDTEIGVALGELTCCTVRSKAQRLDAPIPLAVMYYCVDCKLLPAMDRGICACCVTKCHRGHKTFVGAWTRFYCDCPFGVAGNECNAIFPSCSPVISSTDSS